MVCLQVHPEGRTGSEVAAEPKRSLRRYRTVPTDDIRQAVRGHTQFEREPVGGQSVRDEFSREGTAGCTDDSARSGGYS